MYGDAIQKKNFLIDHPDYARGILEATKQRHIQDAMSTMDSMSELASGSRSAVVAVPIVAAGPVSLTASLAVWGAAGSAVAGLEYASSGDVGAAADNLPFVSLRHSGGYVDTLLDGESSSGEKDAALLGLALNGMQIAPFARSGVTFLGRLRLANGFQSQASMFGPLNQIRLAPLQQVFPIAPEMQVLSSWSRANGFANSSWNAASRFSATTTPWQRIVHQRSDIDWELVRPNGLTNSQAARRGYTPMRLNPVTGKWDDITLHHLNDDPRGGVVEVWRSTHGRFHKTMSRQPNPWRTERPDWANSWNNEQSAYWRWRTGVYSPQPTTKLRLPGDQ